MLFKINLRKDKVNERDKQSLHCYFTANAVYLRRFRQRLRLIYDTKCINT